MPANQNPIKHTEQAIQNWSFDETYNQAAVEILTENAGGTALERQKTIATEETQLGEYAEKCQIVGNIIYEARAPIGSAQSASVWQAWKTDVSDSTNIVTTWADGDKNWNNIATDLSNLSYS